MNKLNIVSIILTIFLLSIGLINCSFAAISSEASPVLSSSLPQAYPLLGINQDVIGTPTVVTITAGMNLLQLEKTYDVGADELYAANPRVNFNKLRVGKTITIPTQFILPPSPYRQGIVINIAELRLYYFSPDGQQVLTFPITVGRAGWATPVGQTYIARKAAAPSWYVPNSIRVYMLKKHGKELPKIMPPGPENPLGDYALYLAWQGYLIHGTNQPESIGRFASSGCIRMFNEDIKVLHELVPKQTPVSIIYYPNKFGWDQHYLYLETHKAPKAVAKDYQSTEIPLGQLLTNVSNGHPLALNHASMEATIKAHLGVPVVVGQEVDSTLSFQQQNN